MILVINNADAQAHNLKQLIEFMDTPEVLTAHPEDWRELLGDNRLEALFVGSDLSDSDIRTVLGDVGDLDPNVPIVMLHGGPE